MSFWSKLEKIARIVVAIFFSTGVAWFIGGNLYNHFATEQIEENKQLLLQELEAIEPLSLYESDKALPSKGKALITQRYAKEYYLPADVDSKIVIEEVKQSLIRKGWIVERSCMTGKYPVLEMQNDDFIVRIGVGLPVKEHPDHTLVGVSISFNDFFARNNW